MVSCCFQRWVSRFRNDESGSGTVEALFWFPLFVLIFVMIADTSLLFYGKAQALRVMQDGNRALSVGRLSSTDETRDFITAQLASLSEHVEVTTEVDNGLVISTVVMPSTDLMAVGSVPGFSRINISVTSQHFLEQ